MARGRAKRWGIGIIVALAVLGCVAVWFVYSGIYNVSAAYPDSAPADWLLSTTMDNSVKRHARGIAVPALDDPAKMRIGLSHYREMCVACHGAPGVPIGELGRGLNPAPPRLTEAAGEWKPNELFWIVKNGVRMSGMPAWGVTHSDEAIWAIVAFVRMLPTMTPAQYEEAHLVPAGSSAKSITVRLSICSCSGPKPSLDTLTAAMESGTRSR